MSLMRPAVKQCLLSLQRNGTVPLQKQMQLMGQISVRNGGHEKKMLIQPTRFEWTRFKNDLHFYLMLGLAPMVAFITYANIFIGPAQLADIPEGYEPKEWEYYQGPIKRWFAKYVYETPQKEYERTLHFLHEKREERYWNLLDKKVKSLMSDRLDYRGWYWVDVDKSIKDDEKAFEESNTRIAGSR